MNHWDFRAPVYRWLRKPWPLSLILQRETENIRVLLSQLELRNAWVIDIGCGAGHSLRLLHEGTNRIGIDYSRQMAKITRSQLKQSVIVAAGELLPLKPHSVDLFLIVGVLEYLADPSMSFQEMATAGKPDCYVLATSSPPGVFSQLRRLTGIRLRPRKSEEIRSLAARFGFQIVNQKHHWSQEAFLFRKGG